MADGDDDVGAAMDMSSSSDSESNIVELWDEARWRAESTASAPADVPGAVHAALHSLVRIALHCHACLCRSGPLLHKYAASGAVAEALQLVAEHQAMINEVSAQLPDALCELMAPLLSVSSLVNWRDRSGLAPVHVAALRGDRAVFRTLVQLGADPRARNRHGWRAIHFAVSSPSSSPSHHGDTTPLPLSSALSSPKESSYSSYSSLSSYSSYSSYSSLSSLSSSPPMDSPKPEDRALMLDELLASGLSVADFSRDGWSPLQLASCHSNPIVVRWLLAHGASPLEVGDTSGWTALHLAAYYHQGPVLAELLSALTSTSDARSTVAGVSMHNSTGDTPLHCACRVPLPTSAEVVRLLLANGSSIWATNIAGDSALHVAARWGNFLAAELLIAAGAETQRQNKNGLTARQLAKRHGFNRIANLLPSDWLEPPKSNE